MIFDLNQRQTKSLWVCNETQEEVSFALAFDASLVRVVPDADRISPEQEIELSVTAVTTTSFRDKLIVY